jgi:hypothetical protein
MTTRLGSVACFSRFVVLCAQALRLKYIGQTRFPFERALELALTSLARHSRRAPRARRRSGRTMVRPGVHRRYRQSRRGPENCEAQAAREGGSDLHSVPLAACEWAPIYSAPIPLFGAFSFVRLPR